MNLRDLLMAQGVSARDIDRAVNDARKATRLVHFASGIVANTLNGAMSHIKNERIKGKVSKGAALALKVQMGAEELLKKR